MSTEAVTQTTQTPQTIINQPTPARPQSGGRVFYPTRNGIQVTERWFGNHAQRYRWTEITGLRVRRGSARVARQAALQIVAVEAGLVAVAAAVGTSVVGPPRLAVAVLLFHLLVAAALGLSTYRRWRTSLHLFATYRGRTMRLYSSTDPTSFWQVCRCIRRAVEQRAWTARNEVM
jgi:Family of unknown function (DUF6232)